MESQRAPAMRLAPAVHVEQAGLQAAVGRQALVQVEQLQRGARVLDGVVRGGLDVQAQQVAGQEAQAQAALALEAEQVTRVAQLRALATPLKHPGPAPWVR